MNLVETLEQTTRTAPGKSLSVSREGRVTENSTFAQLYHDVGMIGGSLADLGVQPGERVAIALPNSVAYAQAFFGILAAGAVAVPLPPPFRFASLQIHMQRIALALRNSHVRYVLTDDVMASILRPAFAAVDDQFQLVDIARLDSAGTKYASVNPDCPAVVQYTSGTSGDPKGVVLTHANIRANVEAIIAGLRVSSDDVGCSWLPLFHDMGLVGHLLVPIASGNDFCLLRPEDFLRRPMNWLRTISETSATVSSAPSSAYAHCVRHITDEEARTLDLSAWRVALNGSEAVDTRVIREFARKFASAGFSPNAFLPVYGLAEATLAVSFPPIGRSLRTMQVDRTNLGLGRAQVAGDGPSTRELVSVGSPVAGTEIRIRGDDGTATNDGEVGQIEVRGASVTAGFEHLPADRTDLLLADGWVRTGDLGLLSDGELYIVGRTKETIIILGQNYYASDIEAVVGAVPGVPSRGVLAIGAPGSEGDEGALLLFIEKEPALPELEVALRNSIRHAVSQSHGVSPREIFFVAKGRIERTSSGKLRRDGVESVLAQHMTASRS